MKRGNSTLVLCLFGILPVVWLGLLIAPAAHGSLPEIVARFPAAMSDPFHIELCEDSLKTVLLSLCVYGLAVGIFLSSRRNYRRGEEHGSAKWGSAKAVNKKYRAAKFEDNKIFTQNVRMGLDGRKHRRSLNTVVVGGSGAGKTRFYAKPNLCQANTSYVVLDPKGELLRDTGYLLTQKGYEVRVLDLLNMERSHCYNPFVYLRDDNDVQRLVTNLFKSTTPKGSQSNDPFWDTAASMLLLALIFYLKYEAPPDEQNFPMVMEMLRAADVREDMDEYTSPLDELFERLEMRNPDHIAVKYYKDYHSGSAKTLKSIQITLAARLEKFNLSSLAALTATDELDLPSLGEKKVALFALIPDNDTSFNFLVSILYTQLFQQLFYLADHKYGGALPVPVHFLMDEFSNVSLPEDFSKILAVMRSRQVFVSIILQNIAALKALFEKEWESIIVSSLSPNVSRIESICRRKVVFSVCLSENMYWSTDISNIVTRRINNGKLGYCPSFSIDCICLGATSRISANCSLVISFASRAFLIACPNAIKSNVSLIHSPPMLVRIDTSIIQRR